jgi:hypothetical protein
MFHVHASSKTASHDAKSPTCELTAHLCAERAQVDVLVARVDHSLPSAGEKDLASDAMMPDFMMPVFGTTSDPRECKQKQRVLIIASRLLEPRWRHITSKSS